MHAKVGMLPGTGDPLGVSGDILPPTQKEWLDEGCQYH